MFHENAIILIAAASAKTEVVSPNYPINRNSPITVNGPC
jgi:hypothetical protein